MAKTALAVVAVGVQSHNMFKKRPRLRTRKSTRKFATKTEPAYWEQRLFQNTYTYRAQTRRVRGWAVRIQHRGRRKTFSLQSSRVSQAAAEACRLYRALINQGRKAETSTVRDTSLIATPERLRAAYWAERLVHRQFPMNHSALGEQELFVRIEHSGVDHYFPLGTEKKAPAAQFAVQLYEHIATHGWRATNKMFRRELAVAFHWIDKPLIWTYTTIHTQPKPEPGGIALSAHCTAPRTPVEIALVESDDGIRRALSWCIQQTGEYRCTIAVAQFSSLVQHLPSRSIRLVLLNQDQADNSPNAGFSIPCYPKHPIATLRYSVSNEADELFKNLPGGARLYFMHRTAATRLLEPLGNRLLDGPLTSGLVSSVALDYFKTLLERIPGLSQNPLLNQLSPREQEVLFHLSVGQTEKEIALRLRISAHTVHQHVRNIFGKLGVHSKIEAILKYLQK